MTHRVQLVLVVLVLVLACLPWQHTASTAHATVAPLVPMATRAALPLRAQVQPAQIPVGRTVALHIRVTDNKGRLVPGVLISLTGTSRPLLASAPHGLLSLAVYAGALGVARLQASRAGYAATVLKLPIVPGPPATVVAVKSGMSVQPPKAKLQPGKVGTALQDQYHALTSSHQLASLGLRDGTLVDLNSNTSVMIKDPLHTVLSSGELFLEVVHGAASHQVQVGTAVAATKGTRLDVKVDAKSKAVTVTVVEGLVQVSNRGVVVSVGAGQQSTAPLNQPPSPPKPVRLTTVVGWLSSLPNTTSSVVPPILSLPPLQVSPVPIPPPSPTPLITAPDTLATSTWSGGPYLVPARVTIPAGTTLTIAAGTVVELAECLDRGAGHAPGPGQRHHADRLHQRPGAAQTRGLGQSADRRHHSRRQSCCATCSSSTAVRAMEATACSRSPMVPTSA